MITHKGSPLVKGKHFLLENEGKLVKVTYSGKIYKEFHSFTDNSKEFILTEQEALSLKPFLLKEHSLLQEQDNSDDLYQLITSYTDKQLNIIDSVGGDKLWDELKDSFQEEVNKLSDLGLAYKTNNTTITDHDKGYLLEVIIDYLQNVQRNISETSLPNHYIQLSNFIYNIEGLGGNN